MAPSTAMVLVDPEPSVPTTFKLPLEICKRLWDVEKKVIPNFNLHQFYVFQRDLFLTMVGLELEACLTWEQFQEQWEFFVMCSVENLFTEILAWKHLILLDPFTAYVVLGDVRACIYLYYADCEEHLHIRRALARRVEEREVDWSDYGTQMAQQFYGQNQETRANWKRSLEELLPMVRHEDYLARILGYNLKRVYRMVELEDFTRSHYLYNRDRALEWIERYL